MEMKLHNISFAWRWIDKLIVFLISIVVLLVAGCTTKLEHENILNSWLGSQESDIVASWGPPDGFYEDGEKRYLTWSESSTSVIAGTPSQTTTSNHYGYVSTWRTQGTAPIVVNSNSSITMIIEEGVISSWSYKGNSCYDF